MPSVLVVNHHSLMPEGCVSHDCDTAYQLLNCFFKTWQLAVMKNICEKFVACDTDIWNWMPIASNTMHDYVNSLRRTESLFVHQLLKITTKATVDYFGEDILDIATRCEVHIGQLSVPLIGCVCLSDNAVLLSLRTNEAWKDATASVCWESVDGEESSLPSICANFSEIAHVEMYCATLEAQLPLTKEKIQNLLPSVVLSERFWNWFETLQHEIQVFIVAKAQFCASGQWITRKDSPFVSLQGTKNTLSELRCWPVGKTLRIYVKRESSKRVIFLGGSDKDGQDESIAQADAYYQNNVF